MENMHINQKLEIAVIKGNFEEVKVLLAAGANPNYQIGTERNYQIGTERNTLLHLAESAEITKALLLGGADVDLFNKYRETPLHYAIRKNMKFEILKLLLKHGADVNATNCKGYTALNLEVKRYGGHPIIIKLLLEYGTDINIKNREFNESCFQSSISFDNRDTTKLMIKYTLIKHFEKDYKQVLNLSPYSHLNNYAALSNYVNDCVSELVQLKSHEIRKGLTLYNILKGDFLELHHQLAMKISKTYLSDVYPIYYDIILDKIIPIVKERTDLLKQLDQIEVYAKFGFENQLKKISLDYDSTIIIAQYLYNHDLKNFVKAFATLDIANKSQNCIEETDQILDDDEPSTSKNNKRIRLE